MSYRWLYLLGAAYFLGACSGPKAETPEDCIDRFAELTETPPLLDQVVYSSIYAFDLGKSAVFPDPQELIVDGEMKSPNFTVATKVTPEALDHLLSADVPANGTYLLSEGVNLMRVRGTTGSRKRSIADGCNAQTKGSRLVRIDWAAPA